MRGVFVFAAVWVVASLVDVSRVELARVVDRDALERSEGGSGIVTVTVPKDWLAEGAELEIDVPNRIACARCEGGGCDACGRSGALRIGDEATQRSIRVHTPASEGDVAVRIDRSFGERAPIGQLIVALRAGDAPSPGVRRVSAAGALGRSQGRAIIGALGALLALVILAAAVAAALR